MIRKHIKKYPLQLSGKGTIATIFIVVLFGLSLHYIAGQEPNAMVGTEQDYIRQQDSESSAKDSLQLNRVLFGTPTPIPTPTPFPTLTPGPTLVAPPHPIEPQPPIEYQGPQPPFIPPPPPERQPPPPPPGPPPPAI